MNINWQALIIRAAKTFLQAGIAVEMAAGTGYLSIGSLKAAAVAGLAAVLSLANNLLAGAETPQIPDLAPSISWDPTQFAAAAAKFGEATAPDPNVTAPMPAIPRGA